MKLIDVALPCLHKLQRFCDGEVGSSQVKVMQDHLTFLLKVQDVVASEASFTAIASEEAQSGSPVDEVKLRACANSLDAMGAAAEKAGIQFNLFLTDLNTRLTNTVKNAAVFLLSDAKNKADECLASPYKAEQPALRQVLGGRVDGAMWHLDVGNKKNMKFADVIAIVNDEKHNIDGPMFSQKLEVLAEALTRYEDLRKSYKTIDVDGAWLAERQQELKKGFITKAEFVILAIIHDKRAVPMTLRTLLMAELEHADTLGITSLLHKSVHQMLTKGKGLQKIE